MAGRRIVGFFCRCVKPMALKAVARRFLAEGPGLLENIQKTGYTELCERLRLEKVLASSSDMLQRLVGLANWKRRNNPRIIGQVNIKIFCAAYLIWSRYLAESCERWIFFGSSSDT